MKAREVLQREEQPADFLTLVSARYYTSPYSSRRQGQRERRTPQTGIPVEDHRLVGRGEPSNRALTQPGAEHSGKACTRRTHAVHHRAYTGQRPTTTSCRRTSFASRKRRLRSSGSDPLPSTQLSLLLLLLLLHLPSLFLHMRVAAAAVGGDAPGA